MKLSIFIGLAFVLSGCGTAYVAPDRTDLATLYIHNLTNKNIYVVGFRGAEDCTDKMAIFDNIYLKEGSTIRVKVAPDKPFSFEIGWLTVSFPLIKSGGSPATFVPRALQVYDVNFNVVGDQFFQPMTIRHGSTNDRELSYRMRTPKMAILASDPYCE